SYKLKVVLKGSKPPIDRTVSVPSDVTFEDLAGILDVVMQWSGRRECAFTIPRERILICSKGWDSFDLAHRINYRTVPLSKFEGRNLRYNYGDTGEWVLDIKFQKPIEDAPDHPVLKKARGMSPPEGCNGMHGYYEMCGEDSYSDGWEGYEVPLDDDFIHMVNSFFEDTWSRFPPVDERELDPRMMKVIITALLDPVSEYVFDKVEHEVIPVGDGRDEMSKGDAEGDRYIAIVSDVPDFPYDKASKLPVEIRYTGPVGDAKAYSDFISGLKGGNKVDFETRMLKHGLHEMECWAYRNRLLLDQEGFYLENPGVFRERIEENVIDIISHLSNKSRENRARGEDVLCPRCATPCRGKVDRTQKPSSIAGADIYPLVITCGNCGRSTTLMYKNDGFNKGYTYPDVQGPACYMEDAVRLHAEFVSEDDPVRKISKSIDLAAAYWRTRDLQMARKALSRIDMGKQSRKRPLKLDGDDMLRMAALWHHIGGEPKDVRRTIRELKRSIGSLKGPYAALFAASCCRESNGRGERVRMYRHVFEVSESCDPDDYMVLYSRYMALLYIFEYVEDLRDEVVPKMVSLTRHLADIMESEGFPSDWEFLFSATFHETMRALATVNSVEEGSELSSEMTDRFCSEISDPHGGLYSIIAYATATFLLQCGMEKERALKLLYDVETIPSMNMDNGPFSIDRFIVSIIVYDALGGEGGIVPKVAIEMAMKMGARPEAVLAVADLYVVAMSGRKSQTMLIDDIRSVGIYTDEASVRELTREPFNPAVMWHHPVLRPFFIA
ncbi:MAG: plasmid pRiA4b ORF-3 family protein, partial [Candidatus Methanomethylophilaceae archaeon]|nr:plasmid pRiA4b ORF-3 family protein [Candidatus Methanomethylophilaceae archaeon]